MRTFQPGDAVVVPDEFCPGCDRRPVRSIGHIVGPAPIGEEDTFVDVPGPYYYVSVRHTRTCGHNRLIYGESELVRA